MHSRASPLQPLSSWLLAQPTCRRLSVKHRDASSLPNVMTSPFHTHSSLVYIIWNYITGIQGLGINATDLERQRRWEATEQQEDMREHGQKEGWVLLGISPRGSLAQRSRNSWCQMKPGPLVCPEGSTRDEVGTAAGADRARLTFGPKFLLPHSSPTNQGWAPGNRSQNQTSELGKQSPW